MRFRRTRAEVLADRELAERIRNIEAVIADRSTHPVERERAERSLLNLRGRLRNRQQRRADERQQRADQAARQAVERGDQDTRTLEDQMKAWLGLPLAVRAAIGPSPCGLWLRDEVAELKKNRLHEEALRKSNEYLAANGNTPEAWDAAWQIYYTTVGRK